MPQDPELALEAPGGPGHTVALRGGGDVQTFPVHRRRAGVSSAKGPLGVGGKWDVAPSFWGHLLSPSGLSVVGGG